MLLNFNTVSYHTRLCAARHPASCRRDSGLSGGPVARPPHVVRDGVCEVLPWSHPQLLLLVEIGIKPRLGILHVSKFNG